MIAVGWNLAYKLDLVTLLQGDGGIYRTAGGGVNRIMLGGRGMGCRACG
jgi:hypothetical protein